MVNAIACTIELWMHLGGLLSTQEARVVLGCGLVRLLRPWQTRTHCCGHIVADTNVSPFARARNICCGHKFCVRDTKNVSDFVQKRFVSATNVSQFAQPKIRHGQQCVLVYQGLYSSNYIQSKEIGNKKYYEEARELENWQYNLQSYPPSLYLEMPDRRLLAV